MYKEKHYVVNPRGFLGKMFDFPHFLWPCTGLNYLDSFVMRTSETRFYPLVALLGGHT